MPGPGVDITPSEVTSAGDLLSATSDRASLAGVALLAAGEAVTGSVQAGTSIAAAGAAFGTAFGAVCAEFVESATGLGASVNAAARLLVTVDNDLKYRFGALDAGPTG